MDTSTRHQVLVTLGSNIQRERSLAGAVSRMRHDQRIAVKLLSPIYETAPVGRADQPPYYNAAALIETDLSPRELRDTLRRIEQALGRVRTADRFAPRTIDLDIALFGDEVLDLDGSHVPDPDIARFPHIALPLADIAPHWMHPEIGRTLSQIAREMHYSTEEVHRAMGKHLEQLPANGHYAANLDAEPGEVYDPDLEDLVRQMLVQLGEDPDREGLRRTPLRVAKALGFLTNGYSLSAGQVVQGALFSDDCEEMVVVKDVEFYSLCEHHILPFFGRAHVAYLPKGEVVGLSKIARVIDVFARRLQLQERLTNQVADALMETLQPHGVAVVLQASHFCMMMRGVQKQNSVTVTSAMRGTFRTDARTRAEFTELIRG